MPGKTSVRFTLVGLFVIIIYNVFSRRVGLVTSCIKVAVLKWRTAVRVRVRTVERTNPDRPALEHQSNIKQLLYILSILVKNPWTVLKYVHVNFMFNLQHFAMHNVSSAPAIR